MKDLPIDLPPALPHPVADSHCHLDTAQEYTGLEPAAALARAARVGVTRIVQVGCDLAGSRWALERAREFPSVVATVAIHPNDAARLGPGLDAALDALGELIAEARAPRAAVNPDPGHPVPADPDPADPVPADPVPPDPVPAAPADDVLRGIGETGLDYFRTAEADGRARQRTSFVRHIAWAREHDLTLVIHDRDAHADLLDVLDAEARPERIVMHCFSGDADFARACLDRGAYLSFAGPVTYPANRHLREALALTPADRLLVETDAPFLTPVPHRGHVNASYLIPHTVRAIADLRGDDLEELCRAVEANTCAAFGGEWPRA